MPAVAMMYVSTGFYNGLSPTRQKALTKNRRYLLNETAMLDDVQ